MNKWVNWLSAIMAFTVMVLLVNAFINNNISETEPGQAVHQELLYTQIKSGDPLTFNVSVGVPIDCEVFSVRHISIPDGSTVWDQTTNILRNINLREAGITQVKVLIPNFPPGQYVYRADLHFICKKASYVRSTPLFPFTVS